MNFSLQKINFIYCTFRKKQKFFPEILMRTKEAYERKRIIRSDQLEMLMRIVGDNCCLIYAGVMCRIRALSIDIIR